MDKPKLQSITDYKVMNAQEAMNAIGFTYKHDDDGNFVEISCCGELVECSGFFGTELIECEKCGKYIVSLFHPIPVSSGSCTILSASDYEIEDYNKYWIAIDKLGGIKL